MHVKEMKERNASNSHFSDYLAEEKKIKKKLMMARKCKTIFL